MIMIDGKEYRNLEEQVQKNKEDIAKHYQAMQLPLNLTGIEVIGSITNPSELDGVVGKRFGDAYVQVVGEDTILWIWTRANPNAGEDESYWLNIPFTTVGERGPIGPKGPKGDPGVRGSRWFSGTARPVSTSGYNVGDYYINSSNGNLWHLHDNPIRWVLEGNLKGPQGAQGDIGPAGPTGPRGERGPEGKQGPISPGIVIYAILDSIHELPDPTDLNNLSAAFIVNNNLYIQVGTSPSAADWTNMGKFSGGTTVFKDGVAVLTWDANTKLDKVSTKGGLRAYCVNGQGGQETVPIKYDAVGNSLVRRTSTGRVAVVPAVNNDEAITLAQYKTMSYSKTYKHFIYIPLDEGPSDSQMEGIELCYSYYDHSPTPLLSNQFDKIKFLKDNTGVVMYQYGVPHTAYCWTNVVSYEDRDTAILTVVDSNNHEENITLDSNSLHEEIKIHRDY